MKKIRVLIVDDSALIRKVLSSILQQDPTIEVIATANDPYEARDIMVREKPDVITLDIEMPKMDGVSFLKKYMRILPTPTVVISSLAETGKKISIQALEAGAVDIITKPKIRVTDELNTIATEIIKRVKIAAHSTVHSHYKNKSQLNLAMQGASNPNEVAHLEETTDKVIGIGASTGGVEHLARIMPIFPATSPGIVIVQHMPEGFTESFAKRLNELCNLRVKEAQDNDKVLPGTALLAPGGKTHMEIKRIGGEYRIQLIAGEKVSFNRPSVDVLFNSIAQHAGKNSACILMTGMGKDGAQGLLKCKQAGGETFIQDEASCVVFGMPGEAQKLGAAKKTVPLQNIPETLLHSL